MNLALHLTLNECCNANANFSGLTKPTQGYTEQKASSSTTVTNHICYLSLNRSITAAYGVVALLIFLNLQHIFLDSPKSNQTSPSIQLYNLRHQ